MENDSLQKPFIIKCLSDDCTTIFVGINKYTAGELDDIITKEGNIPGSFGAKLREAREEVKNL